MTSLLDLKNVHKRFQIAGKRLQVFAVNDVSLSIAAGQTLGLVGESGSGKTTVGRMIAGLESITEGRIEFEGQDLRQLRKSSGLSLSGQIQMVFQEPSEQLDPRFTIGRSIGEPLVKLNMTGAQRQKRVEEVLELVGMPLSMLDQLPGELSAGLLQRVGIARAIITRPKLIILDEPTSALDPTARAEIIALLNHVQKAEGAAYLFISHDLSTVRFASERVAVMYLGMVVEEGPTAQVFEQPRHPYSRALLGAALLPNPHIFPSQGTKLSGEIPSPINLPKGCYLASRCPFVQPLCKEAQPPVQTVAPDHVVRCFLQAELSPEQEGNDQYALFQREAERILSVGAPKHP